MSAFQIPDELDGGEWDESESPLTEADRALIAARIKAHEQDPARAVAWEKFDLDFRRRLDG